MNDEGERDAMIAIFRKYGVSEKAIKAFFEPYPNFPQETAVVAELATEIHEEIDNEGEQAA